MSDENRSLLKISNLTKRYGKARALDGVSIEVGYGEVVVITGPSGCGKSTLLRCIPRLVEPDSGEIVLDGVSVTSLDYPALRRLRSRIGFVFQGFNLIRRLNVLENVIIGAAAAGMDPGEAEDRAVEALKKVGILPHLYLRKPHSLSGGEAQRVAIARALAMGPELMLWDEPTAALDPILVVDVLEVMEDLIQSESITMLIVTHEMGFARRAATRLVLLDRGRVVEDGDPARVFSQPASELGKKYARLVARS